MTQYYNPQNEPGSEKRLFLVFLLVFVGIAIMQYVVPKPTPPVTQEKPAPQAQQQPPQQQPQQNQPPAATPPAPPAEKPPKQKLSKGAPVKAAPAALPSKQAASETETVIENRVYRIAFSNRGGLVKSWILKNSRNDKGKPLDIVNPFTAPVLGYPLSLFTYDAGLAKKINEALYVGQPGPNSVTFEWSDGETSVKKTFKYDETSYVLAVEAQVVDHGSVVQAFPQWPGGLGDQTTNASYGSTRIDWEQNGEITRQAAQSGGFLSSKKWIANGDTIRGPFQWIATGDQYFGVAFMPNDPKDTALVTLHNQVEIPRNPDKPDEGPKDKAPVLGVAVGNVNGLTRERVFVGPKSVDVLESTQAQPDGPDLRGLLDWGKLGFISRPLFLCLKWTHEHLIPNWGWAIAFLTIVITLALLPLRISGIKSSMKMQKIQPQVKAITEKYRRYGMTDPRRAEMQKEMSALYKKEGVNPIGGCFPLLLQMPFLIAFYSMLGNAIELRQANWLWIHDLSSSDPLHFLPVAIVITMFFTQKSTPQAGMDPTQQKMLSIMMPVMLGVISWNLPSGLGIYWAISNLLGWAQQIIMNRTEFGQQMRKAQQRKK